MGKGSGENNRPAMELGEEYPGEFLRIISGKNRSALLWAERAHRGQERDPDVPYLLHPMAVALALAGSGADRNTVCAGILHDIVEDTPVTLAEIEDEFGGNVKRLVKAVTKDRDFKGLPLEKQARLVYEKCSAAGEEALAVKAADLLCNVTDLVFGAEEHGKAHFEKVFGAGRYNRKLDHYEELAGYLLKSLPNYPLLANSLERRINELKALRA